jgi:hypothetical protein
MKMLIISLLLITLCVYHPHEITMVLALASCMVTCVMVIGSTLCSVVTLPMVCVGLLVWLVIR